MKKVIDNLVLLTLLVGLFMNVCAQEAIRPLELTVSEQFKNPIGFYDATPSFSWHLPQGIQLQTAYRIVAASRPDLLPNKPDIWNSGKVTSDQTLYVKYKGSELNSRQKVYWQVQFWDENGTKSAWSEVAHFELGISYG